MKKWKSKKGLTLVELVVTVAILGIVSSMGVGIVANSINNYSRASIVSQEQQTALDIEGFIRDAAKLSIGTENLTAAAGTMQIPQPDTAAAYIYFDNNRLCTLSSYIDEAEAEPVVIKDVYNGVKDVSFRFRKLKFDRGESNKSVMGYLDYTIDMERGYTLKGSVTMINVPEDANMRTVDDTKFYDYDNEVVLIRSGGSPSQAFVLKQFIKTES